ncbi:hypothetical protein Emin_0095 [Elusimicrobium minutum Pei191]|uniref:ATP-grasp domain-containing protein n=1 Tax=Elusimicrobium minutum (strain Pei191) TaxID=445932 RepID=B2KAW5_ELUMP|nr:hypothetical protein [Elusimicrobium minutum]ACC97661.1 hypothetical protein Emin_0095 [Elusimicrobium minutum Pei191]
MADKIWIFNVDDFIYKSQALAVLKEHALTYLQILKPNDMCIVSPFTEKDEYFTAYTAAIKGLKHKKWMFQPKKHAKDESLIQAIMKDKALVGKIKNFCKHGFVLIPLKYTEEFQKLSKMCGNKLLNNSIAIQEANNKLRFKKLCKEFGIRTMQPVFERKDGKDKSHILAFINANETYLLRRPSSMGGYGNIAGKITDLLPLMRLFNKDGDFFIEKYKKVEKTLGSLCILKDDGAAFVGIDCQFPHREGWEGRFFPFKKFDKKILERIKEKSMLMAEYFHKKGVRGQVNFNWAITIKDGEYKLRGLECNSRYNGFGLCLRLAKTVFDIPQEKLHFYLDTNIAIDESYTTKDIIKIIFKINTGVKFKGGIVLTSAVKNGRMAMCFISTSPKNVQLLRLALKRAVKNIDLN